MTRDNLSSAKLLESTVYILSLLPHLLLTLHPQGYHSCPHTHPCLPKHHCHKSPKTFPVVTPSGHFLVLPRASLLHLTLLDTYSPLLSWLLWAFLSCALSQHCLPSHLSGRLLLGLPFGSLVSTITGCPGQSHGPCSFDYHVVTQLATNLLPSS